MHGGTCTNENWYGLSVDMRVKLNYKGDLAADPNNMIWTMVHVKGRQPVDFVGRTGDWGLIYTCYITRSWQMDGSWWHNFRYWWSI